MNNKLLKALLSLTLILPLGSSYSQDYLGKTTLPQPVGCVKASFSKSGSRWWSTVTLSLTNECGRKVDLRNAVITFNNSNYLNKSFYGSFSPLAYPLDTQMSSAKDGSLYLTSIKLSFPTDKWVKTQLLDKSSIKLVYGVAQPGYIPDSAKVYLAHPAQMGALDVINKTQRPAGMANDPSIEINNADTGKRVEKIILPWSGEKAIKLQPGTYTINPENVFTKEGKTYQGAANPEKVLIKTAKTTSSTITYHATINNGMINIKTSKLPSQLSGYTKNPVIKLTQDQGGAVTSATVPWDSLTAVNHLLVGMKYDFASNDINFNHYNCQARFNPKAALAVPHSEHSISTYITYNCSPIKMDAIQVNVTGLSASQKKIDVMFTPNNEVVPTHKTVDLVNGKGSGLVSLQDGIIYNVSATAFTGFSASFTPQPLLAVSSGKEAITYAKHTPTAHIPGWPNYLAMGTVTNDSPALNGSLATHPVDALFKYAGNSGSGDPGKILEPTYTYKTIKQARYIEANSNDHHRVMPVMVVYSINMSGSWNLADVTDFDYLVDHYINLIRIARAMESQKDSAHPHPGTIILNPDYLGMLQQRNYQGAATQAVQVQAALHQALLYLQSHDAGFPKAINAPKFKNNLIDYMQSINWIVRHFAADVPFGWQENVWMVPAGGLWVHKHPAQAGQYAQAVYNYINNLKLYKGPYKPDFLVFDKYERDAFFIPQTQWFYNKNDWHTYINFVGDVGKKLDVPVVMWQIPGGHLLTKNDTSGLALTHVSTAPDYFFGDKEAAKDFPNNLLGSVLNFNLSPVAYGKEGTLTVKQYLQADSDKNWDVSELQNAANHNIVAILWGGGSTIGVVPIGTNGDDGYWLADKIKAYYKHPVKLH